jgi:hypothetical protein
MNIYREARGLVSVLLVLACAGRVHADNLPAPATTPATTAQAPSPSKALPITLVVVGGLLITGGGIALAYDQDEYAAPRGQVQREYYIDSAPTGVAALATGAIFATAGAYLLWSHRTKHAAPTVEVRSGGAVIGVARSW